MSDKNDKVFLIHILESIEQIELYVPGKEEFYGSRLIQDGVIHNYFGVDLRTVWNVIHKELPPVKERIKELIDDLY